MTTDLRQILRQRIAATLLPIIGDHAERIHLIDPPDHPNVGDCAILLGELDFFARELPDSHVAFTDWMHGKKAHRSIDNSTVLLIHGGGNFGDIWEDHHDFRLHVLRKYKHHKIVQLPQSIHFDSPVVLKETQEAIAAHPDFTILTRDGKSEAFARKHFDCRVELCPDMAFAMNPIERRPASADIFCLLRTDKEVVVKGSAIMGALKTTGRSVLADDWLDDPKTLVWQRDKQFRRLAKWAPWCRDLLSNHALAARRGYAMSRLDRGIYLLSQGRIVVTDRLHAHIISTLLSIPNLVFRSYDGKAAALYDSWTHASPLCRLVDSPAELPEAVEAMFNAQADR